MRLYLIRHGEGVSNRDKIYGGQGQVALTENGILDAERLRPYLKGIQFDRIYSSDLIRATDTMDIALPSHKEAILTPLLRERSVGSLTYRPLDSISDEEIAVIREKGYKGFGGEDEEDIKERIREFLSEVEKLPSDETIAAFSHQGFLIHTLAVIFNADITWKNVICQNCAILVLDFNGSLWRLESFINTKESVINYEQI